MFRVTSHPFANSMLLVRIRFLIIAFLTSTIISAQNPGAFVDYKNYFYAFDNGTTKLLEYSPVQTYSVGGNYIAYIDNIDNFKVYYNGEVLKLLESKPDQFKITNNYLIYNAKNALTVFDNGQTNLLTYYPGSYAVGDSVVGFVDQHLSFLNAYCQGKIVPVEDLLGNRDIVKIVAADNILAYTNYDNHFKVFYNLQVYDIESRRPGTYQVGNNIVSYVDVFSRTFKVFYKGNSSTIEAFPPKSYKTGDDMVAYIDNTGSFKVFYQEKVIEISPFEPGFYEVKDNMIIFGNDSYFNMFYKGTTTTLERYVPTDYQVSRNGIAYKDNYGYLKFFYQGSFQDVCKEKINKFELQRDILMFNYDLNTTSFYLNGKAYPCAY